MAPTRYAQEARKEPGARKGGRVLSLYRVSFTQICFGNLFGLALYNLFIFQFRLPAALIGLISALNSVAYFLSPVLLRKYMQKVGTHRALKIASVLVAMNFSLIMLFPCTSFLLSVYIFDGIFASIIWSSINAITGAWHESVPERSRASIVRGYGLSWNLGALAGELTGFVLSLAGIHDVLILVIGLLGMWIQIGFIFRLEVPSRHPGEQNEPENVPVPGVRGRSGTALRASFMVLALILIGEFTIQVIKGAYGFLLPIVLSLDGSWPGLVYLVTFMQRVAQLGGIAMSAGKNERDRKLNASLALGVVLFATTQLVVNGSVPAFMMTSVVVGFCVGILNTFVSSQFFAANGNDPTLKLATIYEMVSGIAYSITLFVASFEPAGNESSILWLVEFMVIIAIACMGLKIGYPARESRPRGSYHTLSARIGGGLPRGLNLPWNSRHYNLYGRLTKMAFPRLAMLVSCSSSLLHDKFLNARYKQPFEFPLPFIDVGIS